ncbi:MAG TPA: thiamine-phosphate kinase [Gemmatimonadaceae bacterium]|nr:thiamine-phosphate kinase [Gemmatimonadaceae bacterium]
MTGDRHVALGAGAEFDAIRRLLHRLDARSAGTGDDAALLAVPPGQLLVASIDVTVENVHFRRPWLTPTEIGYRAATAALSDLAAMAARPLGMLTAFVIPDSWRDALDALADGIGEAAAAADTIVVGGNLSEGSELSITTTVLGHAAHPLPRAGVGAHDTLYVTGRLGGSGAALSAFLGGRPPAPAYRERFAHPKARIAEALWLAEAGATAAIDISDGLAADAGHLAAASKRCIDLDLAAIPVVDGVSPLDALASGEEYELLVSAPGSLDGAAFAARFGIPLTAIGRAVPGEPHLVFVNDGGRRVAAGRGHSHLSA